MLRCATRCFAGLIRRGFRRALLTVLPFLVSTWTPAPAATIASPLPSAAEINSILQELSDITGFRIRKQLPFASITRDQVNEYLKEQIRRSVKPDEIRAQETTLKKFGFA